MILRLFSGPLDMAIAPDAGGAIAALRHRGRDLFRPASEADIAAANVRGMGCYPLVPYSNRIRHGRFSWEGQDYVLPKNFGDHPHPLHGVGWQSRWSVEEIDDDHARLTLGHKANAAWPFDFSATQVFDLDEYGLTMTLSLRNDDARAQPAGLGLHPYFLREDDTLVQAGCEAVWMNGDDMIPVERIEPPPPAFDLDEPTLARLLTLDHGYAGWDQKARVVWPGRRLGLTMEADPLFSHLIVFSPPDRGFVCLEPVSHRTDAVNAHARGEYTGLRRLEPGMTLTGLVRFHIMEWNDE